MQKKNRIRIFFCVFLFIILGIGMYELGYRFMTKGISQKEEVITKTKKTEEESTEIKEKRKEQTVKSTRTLPSFSYVIVSEEGYLTVYESDLKTIYLYTCISFESLPESLQKEVETGKLFADEKELFSFLETYSS